jgi:hypothetical protein
MKGIYHQQSCGKDYGSFVVNTVAVHCKLVWGFEEK